MERTQLVQELENILGEKKVISDKVDLMYYSYDSSFHARLHRFMPDVVVTPRSTQEVSEVMKLAYTHKIPVTPRGAGTGETCGSVAIQGGIVIDFSPWNTIEDVDVANMQVFVRPGVIHAKLNERLAKDGMWLITQAAYARSNMAARSSISSALRSYYQMVK